MKSYIIVLGILVNRKRVQQFLTALPEVSYWYACLPSCIFTTSSLTAQDLAKRLGAHFGNRFNFLIMEASKNRQGRLPKKAWHLLQNPDTPILDAE